MKLIVITAYREEFESSWSAATFYNYIVVDKTDLPIDMRDESTVELLFHELIHVTQFQRRPILAPLIYAALWIRYGYWNHPYEQEARDQAATLIHRYKRDNPCAFS